MAKSEVEEVKVVGTWASPFVMRARIGLNIKSVNYEFVEERLWEGKSELLLKSNPVHKKVPVLIHGDKSICESLIIVQYIDEAWSSVAGSLLPLDPYERAIARFWAAYLDDKWFPSMKAIGMAEGDEARKAAIEQVKEGLILLEDAFVNCSKGKPFFGGDRIGYIDIAFGSFLGWLRVTEKMSGMKLLNETTTPNLLNWAHTFCSDDAVKDLMPETEKLAEFAKMLRGKMKGAAAPKS